MKKFASASRSHIGFVAGSRSVAAVPAADHVVVRAEALHGLEAPVDGVVIVVVGSLAGPVGVDVHSLAAEMAAG